MSFRNLAMLACLGLRARALALEPVLPHPPAVLETKIQPSSTTPSNVGPTTPNRVLPGEPPLRKSYLIPALEIPLFQLGLNGFDRLAYGKEDYGSTLNSGWDHVRRGPWWWIRMSLRSTSSGTPIRAPCTTGSRAHPA